MPVSNSTSPTISGLSSQDRYRTNRIVTLDLRDFPAITPLTPGFDSFTILPADGS